MKQTFKEFLIEWDRGDFALQQQAQRDRDTAAQDQQSRDAFKQKMSSSPDRGDIIVAGGNQYIVVGGSMEGIVVQAVGSREKTSLPHGTKFKHVGVSPKNNKSIFKVI